MSAEVAVVYAHPCHDSFTAAIRSRVVDGATSAGHTVSVIDLHRGGVDPFAAPLAEHLEVMRRAEIVVLVYPTWWGGQPAVLTGWLDRLAKEPDRALAGARRVVAVTTHGSSKLANRLGGRPGYHVLRAFIRATTLQAKHTWIAFYKIDTADAASRSAFLDLVRQRASALR